MSGKKILTFFALLLAFGWCLLYSEEFKPAELKLNKQFIKPGDTLLTLVGIAGFPDHIQAMRGKESKDDYVLLSYYSYNLTVDITSDTNLIKRFLIARNGLEIREVPFKIGTPAQEIIKIWGKADQEYPGWLCYWKRGVYLGVNEEGKLTHISLEIPGEFSKDQKAVPNLR